MLELSTTSTVPGSLRYPLVLLSEIHLYKNGYPNLAKLNNWLIIDLYSIIYLESPVTSLSYNEKETEMHTHKKINLKILKCIVNFNYYIAISG